MKKKVFREKYNQEVEFEIPKETHNEFKKKMEEILETSEVIAEGEVEIEVQPKKRGRKKKDD